MISALFGKKRISEEKLATAFINAVVVLADQGYQVIVEELQDAPEFQDVPVFGPGDEELFAMIIMAGNLTEAPKHLPPGHDQRFAELAVAKFARAMEVDPKEMASELKSLQHYMARINHPSKNTVGAMSQAVFHKFDLFHCQNAYFREHKAPNPIVLRRLHNLMAYFLWSWAEISEEYRITA